MNKQSTKLNDKCFNNQVLSDQDFLEAFESLTLNKQYFNHKGHLRLAWLYIKQYELEKAIALVIKNIKAYVESLGAKDKFHFTITTVLVKIIQKRTIVNNNVSWDKFLSDNSDLVENAMLVLEQHYTNDLLFSESAKTLYIEPDIKEL